ncbi:hypothetical protein ACPESR_31580 [Nocardia testacea]|uniref:hypothetical protein n=1 Tax=Nocardia testacea TaxID=248551 RepID=UPI003C30A12E
MTSDVPAGHPAGFEFDFNYWFDCECGQRVRVSAPTYALQCEEDEPYLDCDCGAAIDLSKARPGLRDLGDIDCEDAQVDQHLWYHTSYYQDWPSPSYRDDIAAQIKLSLLPSHQHEEAVDGKTSLALHLGTYAAAVENMLRRMHDEPSDRPYWLHQVQIQLRPFDLAPGIHEEFNGLFGDVPMKAVTDLNAWAARYVNVHEAPGSISLAIGPRVIMRVRTIPLSMATAVHPTIAVGEQAVARAEADLLAAEELRPDTTGIPKDQIFESTVDISHAEWRGRKVSDEARERTKQLSPQFRNYRKRQDEIQSKLRTTLADIYLAGVTPQLRDRLLDVIPPDFEPGQFHQRLRELAGLIKLPHEVVGQFETASWRTPDPTS